MLTKDMSELVSYFLLANSIPKECHELAINMMDVAHTRQTDRQTDILLTEKKSHYRLICHRNEIDIIMYMYIQDC